MKNTMLQSDVGTHTPTPWHTQNTKVLDSYAVSEVAECGFPQISIYQARANAQFIVKAVNCHADLLEACKVILAHLDPADNPKHEQCWLCADALHPTDDDKTIVDYLRDIITKATTDTTGKTTMSIDSLADWGAVELKAQTHELKQVETPKVPTPTVAQQLAWATVRCAELQSKLHRMQSRAQEAHMWLAAGDRARAQAAINQVILDL